MSSETLREAARVLRERAEAATPAPWTAVEGSSGAWWVELPNLGDVAIDLHGENARYIATVHPGVGLAIAKWLEDVAAGWMWDEDPEDVETPDGWPLTLEESMDMHPLNIARAILGESA